MEIPGLPGSASEHVGICNPVYVNVLLAILAILAKLAMSKGCCGYGMAMAMAMAIQLALHHLPLVCSSSGWRASMRQLSTVR
jgi:hypothetical protein